MAKVAQRVPTVSVKARHRGDCRHKRNPLRLDCQCPKMLSWSRDGKLHRKATEVDAEAATQQAKKME